MIEAWYVECRLLNLKGDLAICGKHRKASSLHDDVNLSKMHISMVKIAGDELFELGELMQF